MVYHSPTLRFVFSGALAFTPHRRPRHLGQPPVGRRCPATSRPFGAAHQQLFCSTSLLLDGDVPGGHLPTSPRAWSAVSGSLPARHDLHALLGLGLRRQLPRPCSSSSPASAPGLQCLETSSTSTFSPGPSQLSTGELLSRHLLHHGSWSRSATGSLRPASSC